MSDFDAPIPPPLFLDNGHTNNNRFDFCIFSSIKVKSNHQDTSHELFEIGKELKVQESTICHPKNF